MKIFYFERKREGDRTWNWVGKKVSRNWGGMVKIHCIKNNFKLKKTHSTMPG